VQRKAFPYLSFQEDSMAEAPIEQTQGTDNSSRVVRKEHDAAIELFITIDPLVEVASI
jgi:hypothetical protein